MKIVILTEGSKKFGLGHIARCTSFYDEIKRRGFFVKFVIHGDNSVLDMLGNREFELFNWHGKINEFIKSHNHYDALILDSLNIKQNEVNALCKSRFKLLSIDDYLRNTYANSIILDWTINVEKSKNHDHNKNNTLLLGVKYAVLRKPFLINNIPKAGKLNKILITMGGTDIRNLTQPLIKSIYHKFNNLELHVIIGPGISKNINVFPFHNIKIYSSLDSYEMKSVMLDCDVAISAGGQTLYELAALSIPTIAIRVSDNQIEDIQGWMDKGLVFKSINWNDKLIFKKVNEALEILRSITLRQKIKNNIKGVFSNKATEKIINLLISDFNDKD